MREQVNCPTLCKHKVASPAHRCRLDTGGVQNFIATTGSDQGRWARSCGESNKHQVKNGLVRWWQARERRVPGATRSCPCARTRSKQAGGVQAFCTACIKGSVRGRDCGARALLNLPCIRIYIYYVCGGRLRAHAPVCPCEVRTLLGAPPPYVRACAIGGAPGEGYEVFAQRAVTVTPGL